MKKTILFLHHGQCFGGATISLLYTLQALNKALYNPTVVLLFSNKSLVEYFESHGFSVVIWQNIHLFSHSTGSEWVFYRFTGIIHILKAILNIGKTRTSLKNLISTYHPDLIYLNSVVFAMAALSLHSLNQRVVWHIREHPPKTFFNIRTAIVRTIMNKINCKLIFISNADRQAWLKSNTRGNVVYNFVDFSYFDRTKFIQATLKEQMHIAASKKVILYLGGYAKIKGILVLLRAIQKLHTLQDDFILLMPGAIVSYSNPLLSIIRFILKVFCTGTTYQKATGYIKNKHLAEYCKPMEFQTDVTNLFAVADIVVFPSITPHFARPAIEAAAMGKPVIASALPGMDEAVIHDKTGFLVPPKQPESLCESMSTLLNQIDLRNRFGQNAYVFAKDRFNKNNSISAIEKIITEANYNA